MPPNFLAHQCFKDIRNKVSFLFFFLIEFIKVVKGLTISGQLIKKLKIVKNCFFEIEVVIGIKVSKILYFHIKKSVKAKNAKEKNYKAVSLY